MGHTPLLVYWTAWTDAKSEKAARVVSSRLIMALDHPAEEENFMPYQKTGGWRFMFQTRLNEATRNNCVVAALALGMRVAHSWILSGDVFHSLEGWLNAARVAGVTNIQWQIIDETAI